MKSFGGWIASRDLGGIFPSTSCHHTGFGWGDISSMEPRDIPGSNLPLAREQRSGKVFQRRPIVTAWAHFHVCHHSSLLFLPKRSKRKQLSTKPAPFTPASFPANGASKWSRGCVVVVFLNPQLWGYMLLECLKGTQKRKNQGILLVLYPRLGGTFLLSGAESNGWMIWRG